MKNRLKLILKELSKSELELFVRCIFPEDEAYLKDYASNVLNDIIEIEKLEIIKSQLETQLSSINHSLNDKKEKLNTVKNSTFRIDLDECWMVNIISLLVKNLPYEEYWKNQDNSICFPTEEEANEYISYASKIKVGNKFKVIDLGKHNDGTYNESAKKFYNITRDRQYCFDSNKIWKIKAVGYYEDKRIIPYVEREFINDEQEHKIEWEMPRYLYKNIIFVD